jgi:hypothetical protein
LFFEKIGWVGDGVTPMLNIAQICWVGQLWHC